MRRRTGRDIVRIIAFIVGLIALGVIGLYLDKWRWQWIMGD